MTYSFFKKGDIIIKYGKITNHITIIGDPCDKFFIIIDGIVNVYLPRNFEEVEEEALKSRE